MKKIISTILVILTIIILFQTVSNATIPVTSAGMYSKGYFANLLKWDGMILEADFVVHKSGGKEYPAYCISKNLQGVNSTSSYSVGVSQMVTDVEIWRTIINGYPYKTYQELGCANQNEAYMATKQAVYCAMYDRDPNTYSAIGEAGTRTLNALKTIVNNARNSKQVKISSNFTISSENAKWEIDANNEKCVSRTFQVKSEGPNNGYTVSLENMIVEGYKIVDMNNKEKTYFNQNEKFKILLPLKNLKEPSEFKIKVTGSVVTFPIMYGKAQLAGRQDYALTYETLEPGEGSIRIKYLNNSTKIIIVKQEKDTKTKIPEVQFELLDEQKNIIHTGIVTNKYGTATIENLLPGKYFVKEIKTLDEYYLYEKEIEVNLDLNETATVIVNNAKKTVEQFEPTESELEVENQEEKIEVKEEKTVKLKEIEIKEEKTKVETTKNEEIKKESVIEIEEEVIQKTKETTQLEKENVKVPVYQEIKLPKTGM